MSDDVTKQKRTNKFKNNFHSLLEFTPFQF